MPAKIPSSWREGSTRSASLDFLHSVKQIPPDERVTVFDNDGAMWCDKPNFPRLEFWISELKQGVVGSQIDWATIVVDGELG